MAWKTWCAKVGPDLLFLKLAIACGLWCFFHSLMVTHAWDRLLERTLGGAHVLGRLGYVIFHTITLLWLMLWIRNLPQHTLWSWPGLWAIPRWLGLALALWLFREGSRAFDNRTFLGISQLRAWRQGLPAPDPPFRQTRILKHIRHPWYAGTILFFLFCLPVTDVNAVWRGIFILYTLLGTELEERKLLRELGRDYQEYRQQVPRYFPKLP